MTVTHLLGLTLAAVAVAALARRLGWQAPLVLVLAGCAVSFVPGVPTFDVNGHGHLLLGIVLPPLLYSAALGVSYADFRALLRPIVQLGVGLVVATAAAVALVAHLVVPGLPLPAALVLGAVVSPPDAVAASAIGRRLGLPRQVATLLSGESMINDAAALTLYKVALAAVFGVGGATFGLAGGNIAATFGLAVVAGVAVGLLFGVVVHAVRLRLGDPVVEAVLGLIVPFAAYVCAEQLGGSGVLAVVAAGLYLGRRSPEAGYASRLQELPLWSSLDLLLEAVVFALIGLQLRHVVASVDVDQRAGWTLLGAALAVLATTLAVRPLFVVLVETLRRVPRPWTRHAARPTWLNAREQAVVSWAGMRGVVTLAAAAAIPASVNGTAVPDRAVLQFLAFSVTIGTLLLQGVSLPLVIRLLGVRDAAQRRRDAETELRLQEQTTAAALARTEEVLGTMTPRLGEERAAAIAERVRGPLLARVQAMTQAVRAEEQEEAAHGRHRGESFSRLRQEVIAVQRRVLMDERDKGNLDDKVMRAVLQELDYEEAAVSHSWVERL
jgi:CPA1 family monovalent cation:H+ antiporter